jgi:hypothetical protein
MEIGLLQFRQSHFLNLTINLKSDFWILLQSRGPENFINTAAKHGESLLKEWGQKIIDNHPGDIFDVPF